MSEELIMHPGKTSIDKSPIGQLVEMLERSGGDVETLTKEFNGHPAYILYCIEKNSMSITTSALENAGTELSNTFTKAECS